MTTSSPPAKRSEEADYIQLMLAQEEGNAYARSLEHMVREVAHTGDTKKCGDFIIGFAQEKAEGLYRLCDGKLEWTEPKEGENCHFEVSVIDATDHRFIPNLDVTLTVVDSREIALGSRKMPFLWHPGLYHYGCNWSLPRDGRYSLQIHVAAPTFPRHDKRNGCRYAKPADVSFDNVEVKTGRG
jgi:hypothetical protein